MFIEKESDKIANEYPNSDVIHSRVYGKTLIGSYPYKTYITYDSNQPCIAYREDSDVITNAQRSPAIAVRENSLVKTKATSSKSIAVGDYSRGESHGDFSPVALMGNESIGESTGSISHVIATGTKPILSATGENSGCVGLGNCGKYKAGPNGFFAGTYYDREQERVRIKVAYVGEDGIKPYTWYFLTFDGEWKEITSSQRQIEDFNIVGANQRSIDNAYYGNDGKFENIGMKQEHK